MDEFDPFEPGTQTFTGTVKAWYGSYAELLTDSGVSVPLVTRGHPAVPAGARITLVTRKYRPLFQIEKIMRAD